MAPTLSKENTVQVWDNCISITYYNNPESAVEEQGYVVRINDTEIEIEYVDGVTVTYRGKKIGDGHYQLTAPDVDGTATMRIAPDRKLLEGSFRQNGDSGKWKIRLRTEEERKASLHCDRTDLIAEMIPLLQSLLQSQLNRVRLSEKEETRLRVYLRRYAALKCPEGGRLCKPGICPTRIPGVSWLKDHYFVDFRHLIRHVNYQDPGQPIIVDPPSGGDALDAWRLPGSYRSRK